jgi:hypothetical protein
LHIGHLVPLGRSNFAYVLGSSGVASWVVNSFEENDCENANTRAHGDSYGGVGTFAKTMEFEG